MRYRLVSVLAVLAVMTLASPGWAAGPAPASSGSAPDPSAHDAAGTPIDCPLHAGGMSAQGLRPFAESEKYIAFLDRADRAKWQRPDAVVKALHLAGDETVEDVGAGSGYFTFRFAAALPRGKVVATDVDPEMVRHIHHRVLTDGMPNVQAVLVKPDDPRIDAAADVVFVADVLHHVQNREAWLRKLASEMKPGARLVLIEFKEGKLPQGPPEAMKIPKAKLVSLVRGAGLALRSDEPKLLPYQTFLVFEKPAEHASATP